MNVIQIDDLTIRYGDTTAVDGLSLHVEKGEIFGFLGPNGAGKTSTIRTLLGLQTANSGRIRWFDQELASPGDSIRSRIGFLPGDLELPRFLSGHDTLQFFADLFQKPTVLRDEFLDHLGFDARALSRKIRTYSTGMRQMIGLATAMQHDPELLILDEPTTGLDPLVRQALLDWLLARAALGRTVLFSSHVLPEVEACADRVALIHHGLVQFQGTLSELRSKFPRRVTVVEASGARKTFDHNGTAQELLTRLGTLDLVDFEVRSADLGTLFRNLANNKEAQA